MAPSSSRRCGRGLAARHRPSSLRGGAGAGGSPQRFGVPLPAARGDCGGANPRVSEGDRGHHRVTESLGLEGTSGDPV